MQKNCDIHRKVLILLTFSSVENSETYYVIQNFFDGFLSPCEKTPKKFLFPQDFVEKCIFDKNRKFMTFWHKSVAVAKCCRTCPHFVLKIHTDFPQAKIVKKVNKINALNNFSTVSTAPIIYYNYYLFIYLFHLFRYFYRAREKLFSIIFHFDRNLSRTKQKNMIWF